MKKDGRRKVDESGFMELKDMITFRVINTEQNRALLRKMPHREFDGLSVIYYMNSNPEDRMMESEPVTNDYLEIFGIEEKDLYEWACENGSRQ